MRTTYTDHPHNGGAGCTNCGGALYALPGTNGLGPLAVQVQPAVAGGPVLAWLCHGCAAQLGVTPVAVAA